MAFARVSSAAFFCSLDFGQLLRGGAGLNGRLLFVLLCSGEGGLSHVSGSAFGGRLGRGPLGFFVEQVGRIGGDLRRGLSLLRRLLGRIVSLLQWEGRGLGVGQRLVQRGLGVGCIGQALGNGQIGLGLFQLLDARLARQVLRIGGLLSLRVGCFARVGVCRVGLLAWRPLRGRAQLPPPRRPSVAAS